MQALYSPCPWHAFSFLQVFLALLMQWGSSERWLTLTHNELRHRWLTSNSWGINFPACTTKLTYENKVSNKHVQKGIYESCIILWQTLIKETLPFSSKGARKDHRAIHLMNNGHANSIITKCETAGCPTPKGSAAATALAAIEKEQQYQTKRAKGQHYKTRRSQLRIERLQKYMCYMYTKCN